MGASQQEKDAYKLMRRGTRACRECTSTACCSEVSHLPADNHWLKCIGRRRKVKCIYDDDDDNICQECKVHNRHCIKQGIVRGSSDGGTSKSVKVQVTRLESAVEKLAREDARTKPTPPTIGSPQEIPTSPQELEKLQEKHQNLSPIFSLFNNDLVLWFLSLFCLNTNSCGRFVKMDPWILMRQSLQLSTHLLTPICQTMIRSCVH